MKPCVNPFFHVIQIMDDIFSNMKYLLLKHCCYCFVRWTVYHLSFCRKVNRQYKYNISCAVQQLPTNSLPSASHREFKNNYLKCHNHRRPYRWTHVFQHLTESSKIITRNATITDDDTDGLTSSASHREFENNYSKRHNHRRLYRRNYFRW